MNRNRRQFLQTSAAVGLALPFARAVPVLGQPSVFAHGVASGDPQRSQVLLWTRVSGAGGETVPVRWEVARDPDFREIVAEGEAMTGPERDHTVKALATGLQPGTTYHYRFDALGERSPAGRTKTLARDPSRVKLAFVSCSNLPFGYFNVYRRIAERDDLDAVLHLGDYLYEYPNSSYGDGTRFTPSRASRPNKEITTLSDYRTRHAQYKSDPDLQEVHRLHPFIAVWDDHEITNNAWTDGAQNHQVEEEEGDWFVRREAAVRAYFEWMPIREPEPWPSQRTWRSFRFGRLADLIMLDTRLVGRSRQAEWGDVEGMRHPGRTLLGARQEAWLYDELAASKSVKWRVLGQQVMMAPQLGPDGNLENPDQWDGYVASRNRLFDFLERERLGNLVVLTGDVHQSWGMDLPRNPNAGYDPATGQGSYGVDFVTTAVSSPSSLLRRLGTEQEVAAEVRAMLGPNPHAKFAEAFHRGYCLLDIRSNEVRNDWFFVPTVEERTDEQRWAAGIRVGSGTQHGVRADAAPEA